MNYFGTIKVGNDHISMTAPHPVCSVKLSMFGLGQYYGGGPRWNPECCSLLPLPLLYSLGSNSQFAYFFLDNDTTEPCFWLSLVICQSFLLLAFHVARTYRMCKNQSGCFNDNLASTIESVNAGWVHNECHQNLFSRHFNVKFFFEGKEPFDVQIHSTCLAFCSAANRSHISQHLPLLTVMPHRSAHDIVMNSRSKLMTALTIQDPHPVTYHDGSSRSMY